MRSASSCLPILSLVAACAAPAFEGTALAPRTAPAFSLVDQSGARWNLAAHRGTVIALYFGYTHCADECPLTLAKLSRAIAGLQHAQIAFVSVDPARDTPARLREYLRAFPAGRIVGLTGTPRAIAEVEHAYHVWAQRLPPKREAYDVAHSSAVFLIDAAGILRVVHDDGDPQAAFAHDFTALGA